MMTSAACCIYVVLELCVFVRSNQAIDARFLHFAIEKSTRPGCTYTRERCCYVGGHTLAQRTSPVKSTISLVLASKRPLLNVYGNFGHGLDFDHPQPVPKEETFVATTAVDPELNTAASVRLRSNSPSALTNAARPLLMKMRQPQNAKLGLLLNLALFSPSPGRSHAGGISSRRKSTTISYSSNSSRIYMSTCTQ